MERHAARPLCASAIALLVAACATTGPPVTSSQAPSASDAPFAIDGRLSARHGRDAVAVAFSWTHAPPRDELVVSTPLGQSVAELTGAASLQRAELRTADGRSEVASDWAALTERAVGVPLPVQGLAAWAQDRTRRIRLSRTRWGASPCSARTAARSSIRIRTIRHAVRRASASRATTWRCGSRSIAGAIRNARQRARRTATMRRCAA